MAVSIAIAVGLVNMLDSGHFLSHLDVPLEKKNPCFQLFSAVALSQGLSGYVS